jgi:hypothetical protein
MKGYMRYFIKGNDDQVLITFKNKLNGKSSVHFALLVKNKLDATYGGNEEKKARRRIVTRTCAIDHCRNSV